MGRVIGAAAVGGLILILSMPPVRGQVGSIQVAPQPLITRDSTSTPQARQVPIGTGRISGVVTAADTGQPARRARVMLNGSQSTQTNVTGRGAVSQAALSAGPSLAVNRQVLSDDQGRFDFTRLPAGQFMLSTSLSGYLTIGYGATKPGQPGTAIRLADSQQVAIKIQLQRGGVITGFVTDTDGNLISSTQVQASRYVFTNGVRGLQTTAGATVDERGAYRLSGLPPGDYLIWVTPSPNGVLPDSFVDLERSIAAAPPGATSITVSTAPAGPLGFAPTYFPGAATPAAASVVSIAAGEERAGINITALPIHTGTIEGTVAGVPTTSGVGVQVGVRAADPANDPLGAGFRFGGFSANNKFTVGSLPPGDYIVFALTMRRVTVVNSPGPVPPPPPLEASQRLWAQTTASVASGATTTVDLELQPGRSISGTVQFQMTHPPVLGTSRFTVMVSPAPSALQPNFGMLPQAVVDADGGFVLDGVQPGRYVLRPGGPGAMKSALLNGVDTLDFPLEITGDTDVSGVVITMADQLAEVAGTLTTATGAPAPGFTVVLAPTDEKYWLPGSRRIQTARPSTDGTYQFRSLPSGDYLLGAVSDLDPGQQFDPAFLHSLAGGSVRVTIADGAKMTQDLRVGQ